MHITEEHILSGARFIASPNFSDINGFAPDLIVIHCISLPPGVFYGRYIEDFFCNKLNINAHEFFHEIKDVKVSSHLLIRRNGFITQFVPFNKIAWHAGKSNFKGREDCNDFSIGIEIEGSDSDIFTKAQYQSLSKVINILLDKYPKLSKGNIAGHEDIAKGRKTDPGPHFNWELLHTLLGNRNG